MRLGERVDLTAFIAGMERPGALVISPDTRNRIAQARVTVEALAAGGEPVYGLNTGLGGNLAHRLAPKEVAAFQRQIIAGRAVATGAPLEARIGRGWLLYRLHSAAQGISGISAPLFEHLHAAYAAQIAPALSEYGSIGAGDLTQNACAAMGLLGEGPLWQGDALREDALDRAGLRPPPLQPKDAMALVNHSAATVALAADALHRAHRAFTGGRHAALLAMAGYGANRGVLDPALVALRRAPGQAQAAAWFRERLADGEDAPRRIQEALSFRTLAPVTGAAQEALTRAIAIWEDDANGVSDSPVVRGDAMPSTANFANPALALALEGVALALAMAANAGTQRIERMMDPALSGLPRYLSPVGGGSAGMVPVQKVAMALLAEIRHLALPTAFDAPPVSDGVEDVAPNTQAAARKLGRMARPMRLLAGIEGMVAAQAIDLRQTPLAPMPARLHAAIRERVPILTDDRPLGRDIEAAAKALDSIE